MNQKYGFWSNQIYVRMKPHEKRLSTYIKYLTSIQSFKSVQLNEWFFSCRKIGLWEFTMSPAQLTRKLVRNGVIRFTSSLDLGGVPVHIEILTGIRFGRPTFAVGFSFDRYSYGKLAEKLSGIGVDFLDKLGLEFEVKHRLIAVFFPLVSVICFHSKENSS